MSESKELKELNHEEAEIRKAFDEINDMWAFDYTMEIMDDVVSILEGKGLTNEENRTDVKEVLYQFGNRIRDLTLDSNYVYTIRSELQWYLDNDRERLEEEQ